MSRDAVVVIPCGGADPIRRPLSPDELTNLNAIEALGDPIAARIAEYLVDLAVVQGGGQATQKFAALARMLGG